VIVLVGVIVGVDVGVGVGQGLATTHSLQLANVPVGV
jgi:hypothetical protein